MARATVRTTLVAAIVALQIAVSGWAYPPAVGTTGKSRSCTACHISNGPWTDETKTVVDIVDRETGRSLRQADGTFLIQTKRFQARTIVTVIGRAKGDLAPPPHRNAWLYVDPAQIAATSASKFAVGWSVDLPLSCRLVGDKVTGYEGANVTALPMIVRPLDGARNGAVELQVMLTRGEAVKGDAKAGMVSNFLVRIVRLEVVD